MATKIPSSDVVLLPKNPNLSPERLSAIVNRYKSNRLEALQLEPSAFSSTYERESQFIYETWLSRATNPLSRIFVALGDRELSPRTTTEDSDDPTLSRLLGNEWLGTVTMLGPKLLSDKETGSSHVMPRIIFTPENSFEPPDLTSIKKGHAVYLIVSMYVSLNRRRERHGRRLLEAALTAAMEEARKASASRITVCLNVEVGNMAARRLYESVGFGIRGSEPADSSTFPTLGMTREREIMPRY
jgi:GNAT superfamily N-acetyltransferase